MTAPLIRMIPKIYENLKHIITQTLSLFKLAEPETSAIGRPKKIPDVQALTFALYQHASTRATKKSVYDDQVHAFVWEFRNSQP